MTAGGAMLALHAYNSAKVSEPDRLAKAVFGVKQQAGVLAAICGAIFAVITALESAKLLGAPAGAGGGGVTFGRPWAEREASRVPREIAESITG